MADPTERLEADLEDLVGRPARGIRYEADPAGVSFPVERSGHARILLSGPASAAEAAVNTR